MTENIFAQRISKC